MNSLHPSFAFATTASSSCFKQPNGTWHCLGPSGKPLGIGKTQALAQADLNRQLNAPKPKHHHIHHPPKHSTTINGNTFTKVTQATHGGNNILNTKTVNGKTTVTTNHPKNTKVVTNHPSTTTVKPILVRHPLSDPTTPKPTLTTGTAATGTGGNAIKQAQNKNQHKVITTTSPSSPVVNDVPTTTDTTTTPDTSTQQDDTTTPPPPPSDTGNQTNVLLIGGAIFVGLMVLLLIV